MGWTKAELVKIMLITGKNASNLFLEGKTPFLTKFLDGEFVTKKAFYKKDHGWEWDD